MLLPNGKPTRDATVALASASSHLFIQNGELRQGEKITFTSFRIAA